MPLAVTQDNYEKEILQSHLPVVVDVYAVWCGPCQQLAPIFDELAAAYSSTVKFAKLNVDEARELSIRLGVTSIPTIFFFKDGKVVDTVVGYVGKRELEEKIKAL
jgi:thioredoxin 1